MPPPRTGGLPRPADTVCAALRVISHATSIGGVESTIERRAKLPGQEHVPAGVAVNQAAVVGTPHPRWGEAGVAFVVLAPGA